MSTAFLGMRGTGNWGTDVRPKSFREMILFLEPNGPAALTAITAMGSNEQTDDPEFSYWDKSLETQGGSFTADEVYEDQALSSKFTTGAVSAGTMAYAKITSAATLSHFRPGHTVILVEQANLTNRSFGVVKVVGANYLGIKLRAATTEEKLVAADYVDIVGNANAEGTPSPDAISYDPTKRTNYTQIFKTAIDITRTARKTRYRTGDAKAQLMEDALRYHSIEMEMAAIFGEKVEIENSEINNKPERYTQGAIPFLNEHKSDHIIDFASTNSGTWKAYGEDWLREQLELLFREGSTERLALCGSQALLGIEKIASQSGLYSLTEETTSYGIRLARFRTTHGDLLLKKSPLFTLKPYMLKNMLILDPANKRNRFIDDTHFKPSDEEKTSGSQNLDGTKEEFLTEVGYEWHHPATMMLLTSVGDDGTAVQA